MLAHTLLYSIYFSLYSLVSIKTPQQKKKTKTKSAGDNCTQHSAQYCKAAEHKKYERENTHKNEQITNNKCKCFNCMEQNKSRSEQNHHALAITRTTMRMMVIQCSKQTKTQTKTKHTYSHTHTLTHTAGDVFWRWQIMSDSLHYCLRLRFVTHLFLDSN